VGVQFSPGAPSKFEELIMDMDQSAVFLAGSILTMMGFIVVVMGVIVINNLIAKYWKDLGWFKWHNYNEPTRFLTPEELAQEPKDTKSK
jgi:hypothetical protein